MAEAQVTGKPCDGCNKRKPNGEVKWAPDVKMWLCGACWFINPPRWPGFGRATGARP